MNRNQIKQNEGELIFYEHEQFMQITWRTFLYSV